MEKIDSFVFYRSFFEAAKDLKPADKMAVYDAIFEYVFEKKRKKLAGISAVILTLVIPNLDAAINNRKNGQKGGRPKKETPVIGNEKGGFSEKGNRAFEKPETNGDVDVDVDGDVDANENVNKDDLPFSEPLLKVPNKKTADAGASNYSQDFEKFWAEYPAKVGKAAAAKSFIKACKKIDLDTMLEKLRAYSGLKKVKEGVVCNPSTWLNQERWHDEHPMSPEDEWLADGPSNETLGEWERQIQEQEKANGGDPFNNLK
jgi:hypothetical protein